ncbi:uncharacterized protein LOC117648673 [Thrips palmi]|uniref:Uncharacterized protein LOC117648673 n=1 Tax=Thrips palmi TaxID=161013 RepID=A0A6P8Z415_THRPL|nr:uncharacterized protein LOC117648673 [Thrips palmi]
MLHASLLSVAIVAVLMSTAMTEPAHHHGYRAPHWDSGESHTAAPPRLRHHLRHHGQGAPVPAPAPPAGSSLDHLLDRLDNLETMNQLDASASYWSRADDRADRAAMEDLRRAADEYTRGDAAAEIRAAVRKRHHVPPALPALPARTAALTMAADGKRKYHHEFSDEDDDDDDDLDNDDSLADEDDKEDEEDDEEDDEDDGASEEADKVDELDVDYRRHHVSPEMSQALSDSPPMSYSEHKWNSYGTRENLQNTRRNGLKPEAQTSLRQANEATEHILKMASNGSCKVPAPVVVNVGSLYPDPSKEYIPHCTILHRCTDATGCCRSSKYTCKAKRSVRIELAFYTTRVGHRNPIVEKLAFYNETECECAPIEDTRFRINDVRASSANDAHATASSRKQRQTQTPAYIAIAPYNKPGCRCPSTYSPRDLPKPRECTCDCFDRQADCLKFKKGKEYFSMEDRLCIEKNLCKLPECEFGPFWKLSGRCPRKNEKFHHDNRRSEKFSHDTHSRPVQYSPKFYRP